MRRKLTALLMLVVFLSNGFYRKPEHVATLSFNQQLVLTEKSLTGCSEFFTVGCPKSCQKYFMCDGHTKQKLTSACSVRCQIARDDGCVAHIAEQCLQMDRT
jgi:hypothetical protein